MPSAPRVRMRPPPPAPRSPRPRPAPRSSPRPRRRSRPSTRRSSPRPHGGSPRPSAASAPRSAAAARPPRRRRAEPSRRNRSGPPHLALPGRSGHIAPRGADAGVVERLIVQAKKLSRFLFPGPRELDYIRKVRASGLFDPDFYTSHHPGMRWIFRRFPVRHYVTIGEREYLRPNPDFSASIYLRYNPDVRLRRHPALPALRRDRPPRAPGRPRSCPTSSPASPGRCRGSARRRPAADLAVVAHVFYHDLWDEIADRLAAAGIGFDLFVTITDKGGETDALIARILDRFPAARAAALPEPRPRRAALRAPRERRGARRLPGGLQDPHQALAAPRRRRPLAAPPDGRHPAGGRHRRDARRASSPTPRRRSGWPTASTTARPTGGARTGRPWRGCWRGSRSGIAGRPRLPGRLDVLAEARRSSR